MATPGKERAIESQRCTTNPQIRYALASRLALVGQSVSLSHDEAGVCQVHSMDGHESLCQ